MTTAKVVSIDRVVVCSRLYCAVTNLAGAKSALSADENEGEFTQQARERYPGRVSRAKRERERERERERCACTLCALARTAHLKSAAPKAAFWKYSRRV